MQVLAETTITVFLMCRSSCRCTKPFVCHQCTSGEKQSCTVKLTDGLQSSVRKTKKQGHKSNKRPYLLRHIKLTFSCVRCQPLLASLPTVSLIMLCSCNVTFGHQGRLARLLAAPAVCMQQCLHSLNWTAVKAIPHSALACQGPLCCCVLELSVYTCLEYYA